MALEEKLIIYSYEIDLLLIQIWYLDVSNFLIESEIEFKREASQIMVMGKRKIRRKI